MDEDICSWAKSLEINKIYHNNEWGKPSYDDNHLFEMLILEGAQAGLSWITILKRRENYKKAYKNFDVKKVANFDENHIEFLLSDESGIIKNKLKVKSSINNAKLFIKIQEDYGSFSKFLWSFTDGKIIKNKWKVQDEVPCTSFLSDKVSNSLYKMGFRFVGSTIIYSYLQAVGVINDHLITCPFYNTDTN